MFCFTPLPNIGKNESIQRNAEGVEPLRHDLLFQMVTLYNILLCHDSVLSSQNVQSHMRSTAHLKSYEIINSMQYTNNCPYICIFIHTDMNIYIYIDYLLIFDALSVALRPPPSSRFGSSEFDTLTLATSSRQAEFATWSINRTLAMDFFGKQNIPPIPCTLF